MNHLKLPAIVTLILVVSACDVINEKIEVADDAANRMAGKVDDSKFNQTINNSLDSVGDKATGFMPEAIRPPAKRLSTNDSPVLGITPDPEMTTPINAVAGDAASTESTAVESVAPEVAVPGSATTEPMVTGAIAAELPELREMPGSPADAQSAPGAASPPVELAPDNSDAKSAEKELAAATGEGPSSLPFDMVELTSAGVTLKRVNIRLGPSTEHDVLDTIEAGTPLRVAGLTSNNWLLIEREGQPFGFILASLVRTAE